jgi:uncharacterized membrane protein
MKNNKLKSEILPLLIVLATTIIGLYFYMHFPERVVTHWGFNGEPNGYSNKAIGAFLCPFISIFMYILFYFLPILDPKKENYPKFSKSYFLIRNYLLIFILLFSILIGMYNLGFDLSIGKSISILVGILFIAIGNSIKDIQQNFFIGIRTPWTLSSEKVWDKTHLLFGKLFSLFGVIIILVPFLNKTLGTIIFILGLVILIVGSIGYSYYLYKKENIS